MQPGVVEGWREDHRHLILDIADGSAGWAGEDYEGVFAAQFSAYEDGTVYEIDRELHVCRAASLKAGGVGIRYSVRI